MDELFELISIHPYEDKRGSLKKILKRSQINVDIEEIYLLYSNENSIRGNHYHKNTDEYFTIVSGTGRIALRGVNGGQSAELTLSSGDNLVLKVPANTAHAFKSQTDQPLIMLAISSREYNELDKDTFMMSILD